MAARAAANKLRLAPTPRVTSLYLFPRPQAAAALSKGRAAPCSDQHQIWLQPSARYGRFSRGPLAPPGPTDKFPSLSCGCECRNIRFIDNRSRLLVGISSGEQGSATHHDVFLGRCTRLGRMGCRVSSIVPTRFGVSITKVAERCIRSMAENARMTQRWPLVRLTCARLVDRYTATRAKSP